jgi:hypothetical protein
VVGLDVWSNLTRWVLSDLHQQPERTRSSTGKLPSIVKKRAFRERSRRRPGSC